MTDTPPFLLQLCPLPRPSGQDPVIPGGYRVLQAWKADSLDALVQEHGESIQVLTTSAQTSMPAGLIERLPNLKAICSYGVGYDSIPVALAQSRGIQVSNTPDVLNDCVADQAWALLLASARHIGLADRFVRNGQWEQGQRFPLGVRVSGKKLGIVGLGRIGAAIAERGAGFRMDVRYHNRNPRSDAPWQYMTSLTELAQWADFLVIATVGGDKTRGLVNAAVLDALGPQGILVNIARGSVIDEPALVQALVDGRLGGAGLDVFADEPRVPQALNTMDNVVLAPHIASSTAETRQAMVQLVLDNIDSYTRTGKVITPVVLPAN